MQTCDIQHVPSQEGCALLKGYIKFNVHCQSIEWMGKPSKEIFGILGIANCNKAIANTIDTFIVFCIFDKGPIPISTTLAILMYWKRRWRALNTIGVVWEKLLHQRFQENLHPNKETLSQRCWRPHHLNVHHHQWMSPYCIKHNPTFTEPCTGKDDTLAIVT